MTNKQAELLLEAGKELRKAQRKYFKTRNYLDLCCAKELEKRFDKALQDCEPKSVQCSLPLNP